MPAVKITLELVYPVLEDIADIVGELLKRAQAAGLPLVDVHTAAAVPARDPPPEDDPLLGGTNGATPPAVVEAKAETKRVRDRTAERKAAKEKAAADEAAAAKAAQTQGAAPPPPDDDPLMGGAPAATDAGGADPFDDPIPAADAPPAPARTAQELMDASLIILRQCYGVPGGIEQVKVVQKEFKVSQFTQVPLDKAGVLYNRALALAQTMNVNLPPGV